MYFFILSLLELKIPFQKFTLKEISTSLDSEKYNVLFWYSVVIAKSDSSRKIHHFWSIQENIILSLKKLTLALNLNRHSSNFCP